MDIAYSFASLLRNSILCVPVAVAGACATGAGSEVAIFKEGRRVRGMDLVLIELDTPDVAVRNATLDSDRRLNAEGLRDGALLIAPSGTMAWGTVRIDGSASAHLQSVGPHKIWATLTDDQLLGCWRGILRLEHVPWKLWESCLAEAERRGGVGWAQHVAEFIDSTPESNGPWLDGRWLEALTVLRRLEGRPPPLRIEILANEEGDDVRWSGRLIANPGAKILIRQWEMMDWHLRLQIFEEDGFIVYTTPGTLSEWDRFESSFGAPPRRHFHPTWLAPGEGVDFDLERPPRLRAGTYMVKWRYHNSLAMCRWGSLRDVVTSNGECRVVVP